MADLRAAVTRHQGDPVAEQLVERLRAGSTEFARLWDQHEVAIRRRGRMRVLHPTLGPLELDSELLLTPAEDQRLLVFTAPPGSGTSEQLRLLRVVGPDRFQTEDQVATSARRPASERSFG